MLTVHHLGISQSERIVWLCEELGIAYVLDRHDRDPTNRLAPPRYKALHPYGTAPVITDGETVLAESGAIIEYIIARHGGGRLSVPASAADFADYLFWLHFANGSMMPNLYGAMVAASVPNPTENFVLGILARRNERAWSMIEARLAAAPYFAGDELTGADINMVFILTTMRAFLPHDLAPHPAIRAYLQRIGQRPAYQRAMAKAEPGMTPLLS
jgi:glutathione S-transferase